MLVMTEALKMAMTALKRLSDEHRRDMPMGRKAPNPGPPLEVKPDPPPCPPPKTGASVLIGSDLLPKIEPPKPWPRPPERTRSMPMGWKCGRCGKDSDYLHASVTVEGKALEGPYYCSDCVEEKLKEEKKTVKKWYESKFIWAGVCEVLGAIALALGDGLSATSVVIAGIGALTIFLRKITKLPIE